VSYQKERDEFIARMSREGLPIDATRGLLRAATTLQRLAEAQCNGDWPADNGERKVSPCPRCEQQWVPSTIARGLCQDCRTEDRAKALLPDGWSLQTQGDPRGYVLRVVPPSYAERNAGRDRFNLDTIGVPCR
jgi:hypothetical protein